MSEHEGHDEPDQIDELPDTSHLSADELIEHLDRLLAERRRQRGGEG